MDESYLGGKRKKKHDRGSSGKVPVFGLLNPGGKLYTKVISNMQNQRHLMSIIERKVI